MSNIDNALDKLKQISHKLPGFLDLLDNLVDNNLEAVFIISTNDLRVIKASLKAESFSGMDLLKIVGTPFIELFPERTHKDLKAMTRKARRGQNYYFSYEYLDYDNKDKYVNFHSFSFTIENEKYLFIQCQDKTEEMLAKQQAQKYLDDLEQANSKLLELSITDELTQLFNVRHFKHELVEEHERAKRYNYPYSLLFIDIDHFKKYNDNHGHKAGDMVLSKLGELLMDSVRASDIVARYGGEEFVVLCPFTSSDEGFEIAERLRQIIEGNEFILPGFEDVDEVKSITVSIGIASFPHHGHTPEEVLKTSDKALYKSKHNGRNIVTLSQLLENKENS